MIRFVAAIGTLIALTLALPARAQDPPPSAPPAEAPPPAPTEPAAEQPDGISPYGFTLVARLGVLAPWGKYAASSDLSMDASKFGPGASGTALVGYYMTPHFALIGGFRGSVAHQGLDACYGASCSGTTLQVPIMLRVALVNRSEGLFFDVGGGFYTRYEISASAGNTSASVAFTDLADFKIGAGYRIPLGDRRTSRYGLELFATGDFGEFGKMSLKGPRTASIDIGQTDLHGAIELGIGMCFLP